MRKGISFARSLERAIAVSLTLSLTGNSVPASAFSAPQKNAVDSPHFENEALAEREGFFLQSAMNRPAAVHDIELVKEPHERTPREWVNEASALGAEGHYVEALQIARSLVSLPHLKQADLNVLLVYIEQWSRSSVNRQSPQAVAQEISDRIAFLEKARKLSRQYDFPNVADPLTLSKLAHAYEDQKQPRKALEAIDLGLAKSGPLLRRMRDHIDALSSMTSQGEGYQGWFDLAMRTSAGFHLTHGRLLLEQTPPSTSVLEEAGEEFRTAIEEMHQTSPSSQAIQNMAGLQATVARTLVSLAGFLEFEHSIDPIQYARTGQPELAEADRLLENIESVDPITQYTKGRLFMLQGDAPKATHYFESLLEQGTPASNLIRTYLMLLAVEEKDFSKAQAVYRTITQKTWFSGYVLGLSQFRKAEQSGNRQLYREAVITWEQAPMEDPEVEMSFYKVGIWDSLSTVLTGMLRAEKWAEAASLLQTKLRRNPEQAPLFARLLLRELMDPRQYRLWGSYLQVAEYGPELQPLLEALREDLATQASQAWQDFHRGLPIQRSTIDNLEGRLRETKKRLHEIVKTKWIRKGSDYRSRKSFFNGEWDRLDLGLRSLVLVELGRDPEFWNSGQGHDPNTFNDFLNQIRQTLSRYPEREDRDPLQQLLEFWLHSERVKERPYLSKLLPSTLKEVQFLNDRADAYEKLVEEIGEMDEDSPEQAAAIRSKLAELEKQLRGKEASELLRRIRQDRRDLDEAEKRLRASHPPSGALLESA